VHSTKQGLTWLHGIECQSQAVYDKQGQSDGYQGVVVAKTDRLKKDRLREFEARQVLNATQRNRKKRDQWVWTGAAVLAVVVSGLGVFAYATVGPGAPPSAPPASLSENREWTGQIALSGVELSMTLDGVNAPQAVANFIKLSRDGFFDESACHRLTTDVIYVLQCGDHLGIGTGNPGYTFGPIENAPADQLYKKGTIAMARSSNDASSHGSQFFIVYEGSTIPSDLVGGYTVFGTVTSPLDTFISTFVTPGTDDGSPDGRPQALAKIESITIR